MCMHALYPTSPTMICWAFGDPTFGKKAQTPIGPASSRTESGATEDSAGASEHASMQGA